MHIVQKPLGTAILINSVYVKQYRKTVFKFMIQYVGVTATPIVMFVRLPCWARILQARVNVFFVNQRLTRKKVEGVLTA